MMIIIISKLKAATGNLFFYVALPQNYTNDTQTTPLFRLQYHSDTVDPCTLHRAVPQGTLYTSLAQKDATVHTQSFRGRRRCSTTLSLAYCRQSKPPMDLPIYDRSPASFSSPPTHSLLLFVSVEPINPCRSIFVDSILACPNDGRDMRRQPARTRRNRLPRPIRFSPPARGRAIVCCARPIIHVPNLRGLLRNNSQLYEPTRHSPPPSPPAAADLARRGGAYYPADHLSPTERNN